MSEFRLYPVEIPQDYTSTKTRWFLEIKVSPTYWKDLGNWDTEAEAISARNKILESQAS